MVTGLPGPSAPGVSGVGLSPLTERIGLAFGFLAQRSRFCLRSAVIVFPRNMLGGKLTAWLFAFATAVLATQGLVLAGAIDTSDARQIAARGSLPGAAVVWTRRQRVPAWGWAGAIGVGLTIVAAWWATHAIARASFDPHPIQALSFTGPSSEVLARVLFASDRPPSFDLGLVPGVLLGSFIAAALFREFKLEGFEGVPSMQRYMIGAVAMGFGGMLAGGSAVGAPGLSSAAVFTLPPWITLCTMWAAAALTDRPIDQRFTAALDQPMPGSPGALAPV